MVKYYELPSGRVVSMEDIIYVGPIESKIGLITEGHYFQVTWATRTTVTLKYDDYNECETDQNFIKENLLKCDEEESSMICS